MELLLDTHSLIWFLNGDNRLSDKAKSVIEDASNSKIVSVASIWRLQLS